MVRMTSPWVDKVTHGSLAYSSARRTPTVSPHPCLPWPPPSSLRTVEEIVVAGAVQEVAHDGIALAHNLVLGGLVPVRLEATWVAVSVSAG